MFPNAPRPSLNLVASKSPDVPLVDGVIGLVSQTSIKTSLKQKFVSDTSSNNPSKNSSNPGKTSEVHVVQSTAVDKASKGKKKGKVKSKTDTSKQDPPKSFIDDASKHKLKYPYLISEEDHYTKDCPRHSKVKYLLKGTPIALKEPFPS